MATRRPNVLFICADQWRADCLSIAGHPIVRTPALDELAGDGVRFSNHFGQCTPCGPSRTSMLTGLYLMNHRAGTNRTPVDRRHTNLALEARKAGYDPALFGYTDTGADPRDRHPNDPVLTAYDEGIAAGFSPKVHMSDALDPWIGRLIASGLALPNGRRDVFRPAPGTPPPGRGFRYLPPRYGANLSDTAFMTDQFLEWLGGRGVRPWFAHLVFLRPHPPLIAPEPYNGMFDPATTPTPIGRDDDGRSPLDHPFLDEARRRISGPGRYDEHSPLDASTLDDLETAQMRAAYYGLIAEVDHHIARILAALKASGAFENTLIVFTSDHGELLGDHGLWGKEAFFDQAYHLPLIIRDPRQQADSTRGSVVDAFSEAIDVMPTILDFIAMPAPRACDGRALTPWIAGETPQSWRDAVFFEQDFRSITADTDIRLGLDPDACCYAVYRSANWKYVHFAGLRPLLFNLTSDPEETEDLSTRPDAAADMLRCAQRMLDWRLSHADRTLTNLALTPKGVVEHR